LATYTFKIPQALHLERFDRVAHALLSERIEGGVSKAQVRKIIMIGAAYLNGSRCRIASKPAWAGNEVRIEYEPQRLATQIAVAPFEPNKILFQENGLIVIDKPANLPSVATLDNARDNLVSQLEKYLGQKISVHHRLDAPTSGCILFVTDAEMNGYVARLFQENLIQKRYLAVVTLRNPPINDSWEIKNQLIRAQKKRNIYCSTQDEGSFAHSRFKIIARKKGMALVECEPVTGRTHQLRVHLAEFGLPILGDRTYRGDDFSRLMLHAQTLSFRHPKENHEVKVEAPLPGEFKKLFDL